MTNNHTKKISKLDTLHKKLPTTLFKWTNLSRSKAGKKIRSSQENTTLSLPLLLDFALALRCFYNKSSLLTMKKTSILCCFFQCLSAILSLLFAIISNKALKISRNTVHIGLLIDQHMLSQGILFLLQEKKLVKT